MYSFICNSKENLLEFLFFLHSRYKFESLPQAPQTRLLHPFAACLAPVIIVSSAMAAIKVHGIAFSTAAMRVLAVLHEKGMEFELVPVNLSAGEHKKEPFLSLNPFGQVPAFEDGDLKMFESRAITQYLVHTYKDRGTDLLFAEPKKMAEMLVWQEVEAQKFDPAASKLCFQLVFKRMLRMGEPDEAAVAELQESLGKVLDVYEARLGGSKYMSGDQFGLADLHHQPVVHYLIGTAAKAVFDARPNVSRWVADILARPAWVKVLAMQGAR